MNENTFGNFKSATDLVKQLNEKYPYMIRKVGCFISKYRQGLMYINKIPDAPYKRRFALLWEKEYLSKINFNEYIDGLIEVIIVTYYRRFLEENWSEGYRTFIKRQRRRQRKNNE